MEEQKDYRYQDDAENEMEDFLLRVGIPPHMSGFEYLKWLILLYGNDRKTPKLERYEKVGERCGVSGSCVERSCRHAIWRMTETFPASRYVSILLQEPDYDAMTGAYSVSQFCALAWLAFQRERVQASQL